MTLFRLFYFPSLNFEPRVRYLNSTGNTDQDWMVDPLPFELVLARTHGDKCVLYWRGGYMTSRNPKKEMVFALKG